MFSLRARLTGWLVVTLVILLALHWLVSGMAPRFIAQDFVAMRLEHDAESLLAGLQVEEAGGLRLDATHVAPVYDRPFSGHYFVISGERGEVRSRSLHGEDLPGRAPETPGVVRISEAWGPRGQPLLVRAETHVVSGRPVGLMVAEDLTPVREHLARMHLWFSVGTLAVMGLLLLIQGVVVRWGLSPLERVREDCLRLESGEVGRLCEDVPLEVRPLVNEVNRLLGVMNQRLERSRNALGNLAHAIKTPLTLLAHALDERGGERLGPDVRQGVAKIQEVVDHELARARLAGRSSSTESFAPARELPDLVEVMRRAHAGRALDFELQVPEGLAFRGDRQDLLELFGNLLDNAAKWARERVVLRVSEGAGLAFTVEDDGPGIPGERLGELSGRGVRLDESVPGHGIGLPIVREIVDHYGGSLAFSRSQALGGLRAEVRLPGAGYGPF